MISLILAYTHHDPITNSFFVSGLMENQSPRCRYPFFVAKPLALIDQERTHVMQNQETELVENERFNCFDSFLSVATEQDQERKPNQLHAS